MAQFLNFTSFVPIALFFTLWIAFPVWLALRRSQGLIRLERTDSEGNKKHIGMYLELGIFLFAIPFTAFFFFVIINSILMPFIKDPGDRFQKSLGSAFLLMSIALFLYIYAVERKIYMQALNRREEGDHTEK
ncbi:hypothetical protein JXL19_08295 [bacterium]|nr:hypothetical protein [bacterium]